MENIRDIKQQMLLLHTFFSENAGLCKSVPYRTMFRIRSALAVQLGSEIVVPLLPKGSRFSFRGRRNWFRDNPRVLAGR
jgi:hypothetical protein